MWKLRHYFQAQAPDVVHSHNLFATVAAAIPAKNSGAVVIATRHGLCQPPLAWWVEIRHSIAARWCDSVAAVCDAAARNLAAAPLAAKDRIVRIYNGAEPPDGGSTVISNPNGFTLVTVGRLVPAKDQHTLLSAVALAAERMPDIRLSVVGGGPLEKQLREHASRLGITESVTFWGEQAEVGAFLRAADAFVLSSTTEGLPISMLEAMACGLPIIGTNVGGIPEVIRISGAGKIVKPSSPRELADALVYLGMNRPVREELGRLARKAYLDHFTVERMASEYLALYQKEDPQ
jgi:glycosyltransferase involved in cell wall biosynthesis